MIRKLRTLAALPLVERLAAELRAPPPDWAARRDAQIRELVRHAQRHTRFYPRLWAAAGADPQSIGGAHDLARLPVVERLAWRQAPPADILARGAGHPWIWDSTGGTTGEPLRLPYTLRDDSRMTAGMLAVWRFNGMRWQDLLGWPPPPALPSGRRLRRVGRLLYLPLRLEQTDLLAALDSGRFPFARCMPWPVWRAVVQRRRQGRPLPSIRLLAAAGETLTGVVRRVLAGGLAGRVLNHFGTSDFGHVAAECAAGHLHIFAATIHVELLAGDRPAAPGEPGELVVTSFVSHARPAVRVRTGDCAAWASEPCPCGSPVPHFDFVAGRILDRVRLPTGVVVHWPEVERALAPLGDDLWGCQVEQTAPDQVVVRLSVAQPSLSLAGIRPALAALFSGATVEIALTDDFRVEQSGKTRAVIGLEC